MLLSHSCAGLSWPAIGLLSLSLVAVTIAADSWASPDTLVSSQILHQPFPYSFPQENAPPSQLFAMPLCNGVTLEEATIDQLQSYMSAGSLTSVQLVTCYLQRASQTGEYIK